jgi:ketosteroid isomerase-like protein
MSKQKHDSGKKAANQRKSPHRNEELVRDFYTCFANRDARGMAACYHRDVEFSDEVFIELEGARAKAMWQMLCERGKDLKIEFRDIQADDSTGRAHWEAWYTFSPTGRRVHNQIDARFEFRGGKICWVGRVS